MADKEASFRKQVRDEFLSCSICLEPFHHPKTLPCLHTFCEDCLRDHAEVRPGFQCPTCRRQVVLCPDGVAGLPDNHFISSLCDTVLEQGTAVFESHCRAHPPEELKLFCTDCEAVICSECWDDKHPNHTVTTARKAAETKKAAFSGIIAKERSCLQADCESLRQLRTLEDTINENKAKVEGEVTEAFDELIRQLTERKENLLEEVNKKYQQNVAGLEEKKDKLLKQVAELSSACDKTENAMEQGGGDFLRQGIELTTTFGDYEEKQTTHIPMQTRVTSFQPKGMNVQIQEMGELKVDSTITATDSTQRKKAAGVDTNSTAWRRSFLQLIIGLSIALALYNVNFSAVVVWSEQGKFNNPSGVSMFRNDVLYIADKSNYRIKKADPNGQYLGQIATTIEGGTEFWPVPLRPFAVALGWDDNIWVVGQKESSTRSRSNFAIARFSTTGRYLGKVVRFENPKDVAVDTNRKYVMVIDGSDVKIFNHDRVVLLIKGDDFGMQNPQHITVTQVGDILVSDTGKHKIFMFSGEGQFLRSFGGEGSGEGELRGPRGICTDSSGNIIVADEENSRIELFDIQGCFIRHAVTDVKNPVGVVVSQSGHLVVTRSDFHGPEAVLIYNSY